ncbi:putative proline-rich receptor-like protein kinase PERK3 [Iris pallida]|uniref:Proline-rich receptor-like protein kinase PERK3 n=1 Tax=Iris pallida TaxID=29817 RepID=A0AAX6DVK8_IRIPA|nr:putative proline-rich receptor-like protein kinase PERK3 [Iris pallida]
MMANPGRTQPYDPSSNTDHPLLGNNYFSASSREVCRPLLRADRRSLRAGAASTPSSPVSPPQPCVWAAPLHATAGASYCLLLRRGDALRSAAYRSPFFSPIG